MIWEDNERISGFFLPDHGKFENAGICGAEVADEVADPGREQAAGPPTVRRRCGQGGLLAVGVAVGVAGGQAAGSPATAAATRGYTATAPANSEPKSAGTICNATLR